jgi:putative Mg2+ transporter-C (MgtC) family protein
MNSDWELHWIFLLRLLLTVVLGGVLGWERERKNKSAGMKTHILISVAGCLLMWLSTNGFKEFTSDANARFDPARLAAQVGGGIGGFLAAGVVLRSDKFALSGYSTAAMLLLAMIIGFTVGAGQYFVAVVTVIVVILCMVLVPKLQSRIAKPLHRHLTYVAVDRPNLLAEITSIIGHQHINIIDVSIDNDEDGGLANTTLEVYYPTSTYDWKGLVQMIQDVEDVISVDLD